MTFRDILAKFRNISFSERDKGDRFERLMQAFLQTVPWYEGKFQHVWLWKEFPYKNNLGGKDTGIDLVAQTVEGDFWAIQCKCYDEKARIDKPAVDSFLATSSKQFVNDQQGKQVLEVTGICIKCQACIKKCPTHAKYFDDPAFLSHVAMLEQNYTRRAETEVFV